MNRFCKRDRKVAPRFLSLYRASPKFLGRHETSQLGVKDNFHVHGTNEWLGFRLFIKKTFSQFQVILTFSFVLFL